jgi:hypothetical protein
MQDDERSYLLRQIASLQQAKRRWKTVAIAAWLLIIFGPLVVGVIGGIWYQASVRAQMQAARAAEMQARALEMQARRNMEEAQKNRMQAIQDHDKDKSKNP